MDTALDTRIEDQQIPPVVWLPLASNMHEYSWASFEYEVEIIPKLENIQIL